MNKGFIATLFAAITFAGVGSSYASAPVISPLPDITVGDQEDNVGTQNNFFVFTNAFKFDDQVVDCDTTISSLQWSFDEDAAGGLWYEVNGIGSHAGGFGGSDLRAASPYASFRDVVFSPTSGSEPFPTPATDHSAGKVVTFFVSDGTNVASADCIVKSVDNAFDSRTNGSQMNATVSDPMTYDPRNPGAMSGADGWGIYDLTSAQSGGLINEGWDSTHGALTVTVSPSGTTQLGYGNTFRIGGWQSNLTDWLKWGSVINATDNDTGAVSTDNYVRAKFYVYATPAAGTNTIPNLRFRVSQRFAVAAQLEANCHMGEDPANQINLQDLTPSTDPNNPSIYRVDLAPIHVPFYTGHEADDGIQMGFQAYSIYGPENGTVGLTEAVIGTYPARLLKGTPTQSKQYRTSATDAGDLALLNGSISVQNLALPPTYGTFASADTVDPLPTHSETSAGSTMDSTNVPGASTMSTQQSPSPWQLAANIQREFSPDGNTLGSTPANNAARIRVSPNEIYVTRWHVTSTLACNQQAELRLRTHTVKFGWTMKYDLLGSHSGGSASSTIGTQACPGVGSLNPDKDGSENGGWYTTIMPTPMSADINPNQPNLASEPGPGSPSGTTKPGLVNGGRDVFVGMDLVDSLNSQLEKANFTIDKIDLNAYPNPTD